MTDRRATTPQEQADFLFDELSAALRHAPDHPTEALDALLTADQAFDALHAWLRTGNPLPQPWACAQDGTQPYSGTCSSVTCSPGKPPTQSVPSHSSSLTPMSPTRNVLAKPIPPSCSCQS